MEIKMKPQEIVNCLEGLLKVIELEEKYCEINATAKFPPSIAIAIAKNKKALEEEVTIIQEQQQKNQMIAENSGKELKDVQEQKDLLQTELTLEIYDVSENDLLKSKDLSSSDFCNLLFMLKQ